MNRDRLSCTCEEPLKFRGAWRLLCICDKQVFFEKKGLKWYSAPSEAFKRGRAVQSEWKKVDRPEVDPLLLALSALVVEQSAKGRLRARLRHLS